MKIVSHFQSSCMPDIKLGFVLTAPDDLDVSKENLPLIVFLHGAGERGTDPELVCIHGIPKLFSANCLHKSQRVVTLSPQCPDGLGWNNVVLAVKELIDSVMADYKIDHNKVSITGLSMGGFGTWEMILTYPHFFSCAARVCGGGMSWRCDNIAHLPIKAFHGSADDVVPPVCSEMMVDAVNSCGGNATLTLFEGVKHNSWVKAYEETELVTWLVEQSLN